MRLFQKILLRLPAPLIAGTLWFLSSQSTLPQPPGPLGWDKLQHLLAYGTLAFAIGLWITPVFWKQRPIAALLLTAAIGSAYGVIDEIHQYFVPGRHSDIWDWVANTLGSILGALAILLIMKKFVPSAEANTKTPKTSK
ncbi:MAG: VanZ family protein [Treponema sp.]|nr:VanZ family protein [Treponema sp.]